MKKSNLMGTIFLLAIMVFSISIPGHAQTQTLQGEITVVSREDGSGTRSAFTELFGLEVKHSDGTKKDMTTKEAIIANKTDVMLTNIAGDTKAIGYVSLGSLNNNIKALQINGIEATSENIQNNSYPVARPFIIATKEAPSGLAKDFIDFILSRQGQEIIANGYIPINTNSAEYAIGNTQGKISIAGSSSVTPIIEKLKEAYVLLNPGATIEIQMTDSTAGMTSTIEGTCDIGMASRELKESELAHITGTTIAMDGIAIIVNNQNPIENLTTEQVRSIFSGETTLWDGLQ